MRIQSEWEYKQELQELSIEERRIEIEMNEDQYSSERRKHHGQETKKDQTKSCKEITST